MKKKFAVIFLSIALGVSSIHGCGRADKETEMGMEQKPEEENAIYGEVSGVGEDAITIKLGTRKEMKQPEGEKPEGMPEMPEGEKPEGMPEMPEGEKPEGMPEMPEGEKPEGMPAMLDLNGEEEEILITQDTVIKRQNEEISVSDISEGDVVMVIAGKDGNAAEISVISAMPGGGGNMPPADEKSNNKEHTV